MNPIFFTISELKLFKLVFKFDLFFPLKINYFDNIMNNFLLKQITKIENYRLKCRKGYKIIKIKFLLLILLIY